MVSRSLVLLECALFVNRLRGEGQTVWLQHNSDMGHYVCMRLRKWGEAVGEKLRLVELKEREMMKRLRRNEDSATVVLPEEPVRPAVQDTESGEEERREQTVSYAVKMAACVLLLEITRFLNDPPSQFSPPSLSQVTTPRVGFASIERKMSAASVHSSDVDFAKPSNTLYPGDFRPMLSHQHSGNLSFDEHEGQEGSGRFGLFDDGATMTLPSPRTKRVSVYLRTRLGRKQTVAFKDVHGSPAEVRQPSTPVGGSPSPRLRKQSLFSSQTSTGLHRPSVYGKGPRRPSMSSGTPRPSFAGVPQRTQAVYRRKSTGTHLSTRTREPALLEPSESAPRPRLQSQTSAASGRNVGGGVHLGASLNEGITRLRRSAQRAFRRQIGRKKTEAYTPVGSPSLPQRKKMQRRMSISGSVGQLAMEDRRKEYSWLDVVEHMVLVNALDPDARRRHQRTCSDLIAAIGRVYSSTASDDKEKGHQVGATVPRSLSAHLAGIILPSSTVGSPGALRQTSLPAVVHTSARHHRKLPGNAQRAISLPAGTKMAVDLPGMSSIANPLATINFSGLNYERFTSSFLMMTSSSDKGSIELFLEEETATSRPILTAAEDKERRDYLQDSWAGLLHAPFSLLVQAAPILHTSTFVTLKLVAWNTLLDSDHELAQAAGM